MLPLPQRPPSNALAFWALGLLLLLSSPATAGPPNHAPGRAEGRGMIEGDAPDTEPERLPGGMVLRDGDVLEVYVDDAGKIYKKRRYQGIVPNLQDEARFPEKVQALLKGGTLAKITWVGFQKLLRASRIFIKTDRVTLYTLYKKDPTHIVVEFPAATVPLRNTLRDLLTAEFNTPVRRVRILEDRKTQTVKVVITVDPPLSYIYRQDGSYVYVVIERERGG